MKKVFVIGLTTCIVLATQWLVGDPLPEDCSFPPELRDVWDNNFPLGYNDMFTGSGECMECHGKGHGANENASGMNVSPGKYWGGTMMANSARDPFWRAKVAHEVAEFPQHQAAIEHTCTKCHAPQGHFRAVTDGDTAFSIAEMLTDSLSMDGVSCTACHSIEPEAGGPFFSGDLHYDTNYTVYGPFPDPDTITMLNHINYLPVESDHMLSSELCANCHTLITEPFHPQTGNPTGQIFYEQVMYQEWLNSDYPQQDMTCQSCHVPQIEDSVVLAVEPNYIEPRSPYGLHHFVGGNTFMVKLMRDFRDTLGMYADPEQFDTTLALTERQLRYKTLDLDLIEVQRNSDTAYYDLTLTNKAGHKFPSGYPSRRAWVEFVVMNEQSDTLFANGLLNYNYEILNNDFIFEDHHNVIASEQDVQVYEMIQGNINGQYTTLLEEAAMHLKDNRIPPAGFNSAHSTYDTVKIVGPALTDPDFNKVAGVEGSGADVVHYHIPLNGYTGELIVQAKVWYQSVPPRWVWEMFAYNTPETELFEYLYYNSDQSPALVGVTGLNLHLSTAALQPISEPVLYPNPASDRTFTISFEKEEEIRQINVFDMNGKLIQQLSPPFAATQQVQVPYGPPLVVVEILTDHGRFTKRVVLR